MDLDDSISGSPQDWLRHARSNLLRAKQAKPTGVLWEHLCFDAQQAAEKAIKAVLVLHGIAFPKTHDLRDLLTLWKQSGHEVPPDLWKVIRLSRYAVGARYPGDEEPVAEDEHHDAVAMADLAVHWAEHLVSPQRDPPP